MLLKSFLFSYFLFPFYCAPSQPDRHQAIVCVCVPLLVPSLLCVSGGDNEMKEKHISPLKPIKSVLEVFSFASTSSIFHILLQFSGWQGSFRFKVAFSSVVFH